MNVLTWLSASKVGSHTTLPNPPSIRHIHWTASALMPLGPLSVMPPKIGMPGTCRRARNARAPVSMTWFLSTSAPILASTAFRATSLSSTARPNTSGEECTWKSIIPSIGLVSGGVGGKTRTWASAGGAAPSAARAAAPLAAVLRNCRRPAKSTAP